MDFENMDELAAKMYLASTDFYFLADKYNSLDADKKTELESNREKAREVIRQALD